MNPPVEIERKFLVRPDWSPAGQGTPIRQGYLDTASALSVRVRQIGEAAFLTIKAARTGIERYEFEYPIPRQHAALMLGRLCDRPPIVKTRHEVIHEGKVWEVDVFEGENAGLVIAEIELESTDEAIAMPDWVTVEVTEERRYGNADLYVRPFSSWSEEEKRGT